MTESAKLILNNKQCNIEQYNNIRYKKEDIRRNNAPSELPLASTSSSETASPLGLLSANPEGLGRGNGSPQRAPVEDSNISYMRLSLYNPPADHYDGETYHRLKVNMDVSFNASTEFKKFVWRLTTKRSEFYGNLPADWRDTPAYAGAWAKFNSLDGVSTRWIGKATHRMTQRQRSHPKMKLVKEFAMVAWTGEDYIEYAIWIEQARVQGLFNINKNTKYYMAASEPVHNFQPTEFEELVL